MIINKSEEKAVEFLGNVFRRSFKHVRVLSNVVLPLQDGSNIPTAEYDCIVVCDAGVYVFEVKGWNHCAIVREKLGDQVQWSLQQNNGELTPVSDPVYQGGQKLLSLRTHLHAKILVKYYVFLPGMDVHVGPDVPSSVITAQDLAYAIRVCRSNAKHTKKSYTPLDDEAVDLVVRMIEELAVGHTLEAHIESCQRLREERKSKREASCTGDERDLVQLSELATV